MPNPNRKIDYPAWLFLTFLRTQPTTQEIPIVTSTQLVFLSNYQSPTSRTTATLQAWLPVMLFSIVFAVESTAAFGTDHTSAPLHNFLQLIVGSAVDHDWSYIHHIIRKTGHFTGYGILSLISFRGFWLSFGESTRRFFQRRIVRQLASHAGAVAVTFLVASADEIHQSFLPNRTGLFSDVLLDTSGALVLQFVFFLLLSVIALWRKNPAEESAPYSSESEPQHQLPRAA
jgi:VanZ family protein